MISISNLFISNAYADGLIPASGAGITDFLPLIALVAVFYFLILRPQQKRAKEVKLMLEAMQKGEDEMLHMRHEYDLRRRLFVSGLNRIGLDCFEPKGAFYAFPSIQRWGLSSEEFAERLLHEQKVAVVPGNVFGPSGEGFLRCSYATSREELIEALDRMETFIKGL